MIHILVGDGCFCSGIIDVKLSMKLQRPRIPIYPRRLQTAEISDNKIDVHSITYITLGLDGHITSKLWLYVVPNITYELIFGKKFLEDQNAIIQSKE